MCLTAGAAAGDGAVLEACNGSRTQRWTLNPEGEIVNEATGLCLDWAQAYTSNGRQLDVEQGESIVHYVRGSEAYEQQRTRWCAM
jgi:hypothetical protein